MVAWGTVGLALAALLAAPAGGPASIILATTTALAVGAGAEAHARLHPSFGSVTSRRLHGYWIGPALTALAAALIGGPLEGPLDVGMAVLGAALVGVVIIAQDRELQRGRAERWSSLWYALVLFLVAFALFVVIFGSRESIYLAGMANWVVAALLAVALFRPTGAGIGRVWLFAALAGLGVGELSLALATWVVAGLLGGACLLLYFYVTAGLLQALLDGTLDRRLVIEYGIVGLVGVVLILSTSPWRP